MKGSCQSVSTGARWFFFFFAHNMWSSFSYRPLFHLLLIVSAWQHEYQCGGGDWRFCVGAPPLACMCIYIYIYEYCIYTVRLMLKVYMVIMLWVGRNSAIWWHLGVNYHMFSSYLLLWLLYLTSCCCKPFCVQQDTRKEILSNSMGTDNNHQSNTVKIFCKQVFTLWGFVYTTNVYWLHGVLTIMFLSHQRILGSAVWWKCWEFY